MMEDLLINAAKHEAENSESHFAIEATQSVVYDNQQSGQVSVKSDLSKNTLIGNYLKWRFFLLIWKKLELLKLDWGRRKMSVDNIDTPEIYARFCESYRKEVQIPVLKILINKAEAKGMYDNLVDFRQPIVLPPEVSELESKIKQITRLLEKLELSMIDETVQRVQKEIKLVLSERGREENTLTTDLWKKSV